MSDTTQTTTDQRTDPEPDADADTTTGACDGCGRPGNLYPLFEGDEVSGYRIPAGETMCRTCAKEQNVHTPADMTDQELIAAIVDDSHGYASPKHAARHVSDYRAGRDALAAEDRKYGCWCERGSACFDNDLDALIESARRHWLTLTDDQQAAVCERIDDWQTVEATEDTAASLSLSMLYPTTTP